MAKQLPYRDEAGKLYPESYWRPCHFNLNMTEKKMVIVFYGWENEQARRECKHPVGFKQYEIQGEAFDVWYPKLQHPLQLSYDYACQCFDMAIKTPAGAVLKCFFAETKDV